MKFYRTYYSIRGLLLAAVVSLLGSGMWLTGMCLDLLWLGIPGALLAVLGAALYADEMGKPPRPRE